MDELIQLFGDIPLSTVIIFIAAMGFLIAICVKCYNFIVKNHDAFQEKDQVLEHLKLDVQEMKKDQKGLEDTLKEILRIQKDIIAKQEAFEAENRVHSLNKLRDRLLQSYRYYTSTEKNPLGAWSEMEREAFFNLFHDYENLGGNGFIHSTVEPAMSALEVVSMNNENRITDLMKSRKG